MTSASVWLECEILLAHCYRPQYIHTLIVECVMGHVQANHQRMRMLESHLALGLVRFGVMVRGTSGFTIDKPEEVTYTPAT